MTQGQINLKQYEQLKKPINSTRVAKRDAPGRGSRQLSYLEAWDVKAHLTRVFGFGGYDEETLREQCMGVYPYTGKENAEMVCVVWQATVRLIVRDQFGNEIARYVEGAVGSATGRANSSDIGDLHDNALKQAASDGLKRCATNLGTQFGLSLYNNGQTTDVVKGTIVGPEGFDEKPAEENAVAAEVLSASLGAQPVTADA